MRHSERTLGDWAGGFTSIGVSTILDGMITQRSIVSATAIGRMKTLRKAIVFVTRYSQYTPYFRKVNRFPRFGVFAMSEFLPVSQPSSASDANKIVILEEGVEVQHTKAYGIGIDCHKDFIQVSVLVKRDLRIFEYRQDFPTNWNGLLKAMRWAHAVVENCSDPNLSFNSDPPLPFHYCIESTSCYHLPVLDAWRGVPSVVNPTIAKAGRCKTDILDAKLLATA